MVQRHRFYRGYSEEVERSEQRWSPTEKREQFYNNNRLVQNLPRRGGCTSDEVILRLCLVSATDPLAHVGPLHQPHQRLHHLRHRRPELRFSLHLQNE